MQQSLPLMAIVLTGLLSLVTTKAQASSITVSVSQTLHTEGATSRERFEQRRAHSATRRHFDRQRKPVRANRVSERRARDARHHTIQRQRASRQHTRSKRIERRIDRRAAHRAAVRQHERRQYRWNYRTYSYPYNHNKARWRFGVYYTPDYYRYSHTRKGYGGYWIWSSLGKVPRGAVYNRQYRGYRAYVCSARHHQRYYSGWLVPGKGCYINYYGRELRKSKYRVLVY